MTGALQTYPIDRDARLGPAMTELSPMMRQFVLAILQTGCSQAKAAELAGYTGNAATLKATGWRLAHDDRVQAAIQEEARKLIRDTAGMAIGVIADIAQDRTLPPRDRLKAAVELLNRSGLHPHTEHHVTVERQRQQTTAALVERVRALAGHFGLDAPKLLAAVGITDPIDAEFVEVQPSEPPSPRPEPER